MEKKITMVYTGVVLRDSTSKRYGYFNMDTHENHSFGKKMCEVSIGSIIVGLREDRDFWGFKFLRNSDETDQHFDRITSWTTQNRLSLETLKNNRGAKTRQSNDIEEMIMSVKRSMSGKSTKDKGAIAMYIYNKILW